MVTRCLATSRRRLRRPICCRNGSNNHNNYNKLALRLHILAVGNFAKSERRLRGSRFASWRKTSSLTTTWRGFVDTRSQSPWILPRDRYISNIFAFHHSSFHFFAKKIKVNSWPINVEFMGSGWPCAGTRGSRHKFQTSCRPWHVWYLCHPAS